MLPGVEPVKGFMPGGRKRRTRGHIIADLGVHHLEGHVLRCGYTLERITHDYGLDVVIRTFDARGLLRTVMCAAR